MRKVLIFSFSLFIAATIFASSLRADEEEDFFVGRRAYQDGFYNVAERKLTDFLRSYPGSEWVDEARLLTAQCFYYQGKFNEALRHLDILFKKDKFPDAALYWMGEVYFQGKDFDNAIISYERLISKFPNSSLLPFGHYSRALSFYEKNEFEKAISFFAELKDKFPTHSTAEQAHFKISEALYNLGKLKESQTEFKAFIRRYSASEMLPPAHYHLGEIDYLQGDFAEAVKKFFLVYELSPQDELKLYTKKAIGQSYIRQGEYEKAKAIFTELT